MVVLLAIALKSVIVAGAALGLLALMKRRSAAERSWVAHVGLVALVLLALAPLVLPSWNVEAPAMLGETPMPAPAAASSSSSCVVRTSPSDVTGFATFVTLLPAAASTSTVSSSTSTGTAATPTAHDAGDVPSPSSVR